MEIDAIGQVSAAGLSALTGVCLCEEDFLSDAAEGVPRFVAGLMCSVPNLSPPPQVAAQVGASTRPHLHQDCAHRRSACAGTAQTRAVIKDFDAAVGALASDLTRATIADVARCHRRAHPAHICAGTGLTPFSSATAGTAHRVGATELDRMSIMQGRSAKQWQVRFDAESIV